MKKVFLFSGKISSGKNQFAEYVSNIYKEKGVSVVFDLFAADLKAWSKQDFKALSDTLNGIGMALQRELLTIRENYKSYGMNQGGVFDNISALISKLFVEDENWFEKKTDITRALLQLYGTQIFRERVDDMFWVKRTKERILKYGADIILITDVRFPNEVEFISDSDKYETISVRINRPLDRNGQQHEHISETALDNYAEWAYIIDNNSGLDHLKECAHGLVESVELYERTV